MDNELEKDIFEVDDAGFERLALNIFRYQHEHNGVYRQYCDAIHIRPEKIKALNQIPFLPIQFFKTKKIITGDLPAALIFESSGTTGAVNSKHYVQQAGLYEQSFLKAFDLFYGSPSDYCIVGLLPSYLERKNSSLVYMVNELISRSGKSDSGFYLYNHHELHQLLLKNDPSGQPTLLIGVTYALLDFAENYQMQLNNTIVIETGGMKGRREEITRSEVQEKLSQQLGLKAIHSEYGMTELLSQAYSPGQGIFSCPPWMKILLRAEDDPFDIILPADIKNGFSGGAVNIIDLANLYSCSFIATDDIGKLYNNESFEILGRLDNSDTRGCGLMIA